MAITRRLSAEDGNLESSSVFATRVKKYSDIDLAFANKPSGEIYKKNDAAAVKQAVSNLLQTNHFEKPFQPFFGGNLRYYLFELADDNTAYEVYDNVIRAINRYEPRANVLEVDVNSQPDSNSLAVKVVFEIVNTGEVVAVTTNISRLR